MRAAAALKLLRARLRDGRFALADLGAALVGNPSIAAFVEHHALLYDDLRDPVALLRGETHDAARALLALRGAPARRSAAGACAPRTRDAYAPIAN